ncbi:MAG: flagellar biosynthetic protein FliO [Sphingomonadaceae bacterium]
MIGEFLLRLLVALPLVLGVAVLVLLAMRRGWLPVPGQVGPMGPFTASAGQPGETRLDLVASRALQPGVRVAVVRYAGQEFLLGVSPQGVTLLSPQAPAVARPAILEVAP